MPGGFNKAGATKTKWSKKAEFEKSITRGSLRKEVKRVKTMVETC